MPSRDVPRGVVSNTRFTDPPSYSYFKDKQEFELEELRQRGLTTLLNRHFTEAIRRVALETEAVDAAQQDLDQRRARAATTQTTKSNRAEFSPLDAMCLKVNQWKKETRRKERETLLMYQRYVDTFGKPKKNLYRIINPTLSQHVRIKPTGPRKAAITCRNNGYSHGQYSISSTIDNTSLAETTSLPILQEDRHTDLDVVHGISGDWYTETLSEPVKLPFAECTSDDSLSAIPYYNDDSSSDHSITVENTFTKNPTEESLNDNSVAARQALFLEDDALSLCSGLTLNSEQTRRVLQECKGTVARFLIQEHMEVRKLMEAEEDEDQPIMMASSDESTVVSTRVADQAEMIARKMKRILDDHETGSEVKSTSLLTAASETKCRRVVTENLEEEWFAYYDETFQRDYFHERKTNRTQWEHPDDCAENSFSAADVLLDKNDVIHHSGKRQISGLCDAYKRKLRKSKKRRRRLWIAFWVCCVLIGILKHRSTEKLVPENIAGLSDGFEIATVENDWTLQIIPTQDGGGGNEEQELDPVMLHLNEDDHGQCFDFLVSNRIETISSESESAPQQVVVTSLPRFRRMSIMKLIGIEFQKTTFDMESFIESIMQ